MNIRAIILALVCVLQLASSHAQHHALPTMLEFFSARENRIGWRIQKAEDLSALTLERSGDGRDWSPYAQLPQLNGYGDTVVLHGGFYRLHMPGGSVSYSHTVRVVAAPDNDLNADRAAVYTLDGKYLGTLGTVELQAGERYVIRGEAVAIIQVSR